MIDKNIQELIKKARTTKRDPNIPVKDGYIRTGNGDIYWKTMDNNEYPICPDCGKKTVFEIFDTKKTKELDRLIGVLAWYCDTEECKKKRRSYYNKSKEIEICKYGIKNKYANCTFKSFKGHDPIVKKVKKYSDNPTVGLLLTGNHGSGKTHLACAVLIGKLLSGNVNLFFKSIPELLIDIQATFNDPEQTVKDLLDTYIYFNLLVLDDLGAENITDFTTSMLYQLIDNRLAEEKPTIITTNLSIKQIRDKISDRIASRLKEYQIINFHIPDYRGE